MALSFIFGSAGAGKSHTLYKKMTEEAEKPEHQKEQYIALVPEQYSMETQKEILLCHKRHGSFQIEVVSFARLAYALFDELHMNHLHVMDDLGKTLVMRKVLEQCKNDLLLYKNKVNKTGFVEKAKMIVSEMKQYNYCAKDIDAMITAANDRTVLKSKLTDIKRMMECFDNYIEEKMLSGEDVLNLFCEHVEKSEKIKHSHIYIDSFTGFTPIQYKVLEKLIRFAKDVTVAVTLPEDEVSFHGYDRQELFSLSKETVVKLQKLAIRTGAGIGESYIAGKGERPYRIRGQEVLCHVERNIFRNRKREIFDRECQAIEVHSCENPRAEVKFIANEIAKLMRTGKYHYRDIAVIAGDMEGYYRYIKEEFAKCNIPEFIDYKRNIASNPYVDGILALLEMIEKDFSYEAVFRFLKLGILDIDREKTDIFENYVIAYGRRGYKSYAQYWEKKSGQMTEEELDTVNEVREIFVNAVRPLHESVRAKKEKIVDTTKALYEFIVSLGWQQQIHDDIKRYRKENNLDRAKEYEQIYGQIISLFDRIVTLLGDETVTLREYKQIVRAGLESIRVGIIPPGLDTVMVGDLERTRLKDIKKIIFFAGVNDTIVPAVNSKSGIITDMDRDFLSGQEFVLAPTAGENVFQERLYLYALFAKPSEKLYLSYSNNASDGSMLRKSYIISDIEKMFPKLQEISDAHRKMRAKDITNVYAAVDFVAEGIRSDENIIQKDEIKQVISNLMAGEDTKRDIDMMLEGAFYMPKQPEISEMTARELYGNMHNLGITRLESYAGCAYSQFFNTGLNLKERKKYEIAAFDIGNLYHYSLEMFCKKLKDMNIDWKTLSEEKSSQIAKECVERVIRQYENDALNSSAKNQYISERVLKNTIQTVSVLEKHLQDGKFEAEEYEMTSEHGRIDRVDLFETEDKVYVKVIDYKSGNRKFSISDTYMGLQMQLMIYLKDAVNIMKKKYPDKQVCPAGAFYYVIKDPYIAKPQSDQSLINDIGMKQYIEQARMKEFKMSGIFGKEEEILTALDNTGKKNSEIIPLRYTRDGIYKDTMALCGEDFTTLLEYVEKNAQEMKQEMFHGNIEINPVEGKCTYCAYRNACRFDERNGDKYRKKQKLGIDDVMNIIKEDREDGGAK